QTSRRLERRLRELASLQAVGQALSASLRLDDILQAIYAQVARLMPVENFYVALYDPETDEVRFPLAYEGDQKVNWQSRKTGKGLTEYLLTTRQPLLIKGNLEAHLSELGIAHVGRPAESWLGVPILAGEQPLGVIAVQSHSTPEAFDDSHREILITIAAQAGVAIQNARLYERTDEALARRVQELNSILRTATEGLLLLNLEFGILAANRALAEFLALPQAELVQGPGDGNSLLARTGLLGLIGYSADSLAQECQTLAAGVASDHRKVIKVLGPPERHLERTLTPVRAPQGEINGWLLVFRDLTEELELARLREDLTHMLVHDLRTPLTSLKGSLWVMRQELKQAGEHTHEMLDMSERSVDRIVGMVNSLLDIAKLETGQMPLHLELTSVVLLLEEVAGRLSGLAREAGIRLVIDTPANLPKVKLDPEQIRRTLTNLVDNAIKFTPDEGAVHLWARMTQDETGCNLLFGIRDTGPGIPKEAQSRLFQKFQQVPNAEGRRRGTGLGLAYCKLVIEAHGGQIWVESELGQGANFVICLPLAAAGDPVLEV
ncbi:MAG: GAF domain-containing protein, partial [Anaerolineales bacterium]|nr:GAF domain-containing protein [Anaerolineales bacterium]